MFQGEFPMTATSRCTVRRPSPKPCPSFHGSSVNTPSRTNPSEYVRRFSMALFQAVIDPRNVRTLCRSFHR